MEQEKKERGLHQLFEVGIILKGLNALIESVLGFALLFVNVGDIVRTLAENELLDDPNDFFATHALQFASGHLSPQSQYFAALYLLSHGLIKVVLMYGLLRNRLWAFPASLAVLALFIAYQSIKWLQTHSILLLLLTIFDLVVIWLIWNEYQRVLKKRHLDTVVVQ